MLIEDILIDKKKCKGEFYQRASICQQIKSAMRWQANWDALSDVKKEALEMIADKISNILNSDSEGQKDWYSIAGYAKLAGDLNIESGKPHNSNMSSLNGVELMPNV